MARRKRWSTWYAGREIEWNRLPLSEREIIAFKATGCLIAYPTWESPVDCVHGKCQVRRGERKPITLVNGALMYERESGWLRFSNDRDALAQLYRGVRKAARETGVYDIWALGWQNIVYTGILS